MQDDEAGRLTELVDRHGRMVFATAYRILGSPEDAEDVLQEVFLKILSRNGRLKAADVRDWGAYLRVVASRCAVDLLRRRPRRNEEGAELPEDLPAPADQNPRHAASQRQRAQLLRRALSELPERDATLIALKYFEDFSYEEIAQQTGENVNAVGVILHRARKRLQEILEPLVAHDGRRDQKRETLTDAGKGE